MTAAKEGSQEKKKKDTALQVTCINFAQTLATSGTTPAEAERPEVGSPLLPTPGKNLHTEFGNTEHLLKKYATLSGVRTRKFCSVSGSWTELGMQLYTVMCTKVQDMSHSTEEWRPMVQTPRAVTVAALALPQQRPQSALQMVLSSTSPRSRCQQDWSVSLTDRWLTCLCVLSLQGQ